MTLEPPKYMGPVARAEFYRMRDLMNKAGILDEMDLSLLIDYANAFEEVEDMTIQLRAQGANYTTMTTAYGPIESGEFKVLNKRREELGKLRRDLGITTRQRHGRHKVTAGTNDVIDKDEI